MSRTFADKFEEALQRKQETEPQYGLRTLARALADGDPRQTEIIRRRLHKYRPPKGGGAAQVAPTPPTRWEIEDALGLERDALAPDPVETAAAEFLAVLAPFLALSRLAEDLERRLVV